MLAHIHFRGTVLDRLRRGRELAQVLAQASVQRMFKGPRRKGWNWFLEMSTAVLKRELIAAFNLPDVNAARQYLDSVLISSPAIKEMQICSLDPTATVRGTWFVPANTEAGLTILYFHGGGYAFYPRCYTNFISLIALTAKSRTFALDYCLSPEHRFPEQLDDALTGYRWLLENGTVPGKLVVAGDSAGANLAIALLLAVRGFKLPLPALTIALSPPTDFKAEYPSMVGNQDFDWITKPMLTKWADWFCDTEQRSNPLVSPLWADLRGLPPIYIQAGSAELLYDSIEAFANRAKSQGVDVLLETWEGMNHVFQVFGPDVPQAAAAMRRIGEVLDDKVTEKEVIQPLATTKRLYAGAQ
jgi:monoterpene epsilon-lactone hydrolase